MCVLNRNSVLRVVSLLATLWVAFACSKDPASVSDGTGPVCLAPPDSIVGWWPLDELGSGAEELVEGNHGDYIEIPLEAEGKVGGSLRFDGINDLIAIADPGGDWAYDISGDITLEAWIKRDTDQTGQQMFVSKYGVYYLGIRSGHVYSYIPYTCDFIGATKIPTGEWFHVAVTYDVDDRVVKLHLNGEVDAAVVAPGNNVVVNDASIYIAGLPGQQFFKGFIDEVSIYNKALSTTEIRDIYTSGSLGKCKQ